MLPSEGTEDDLAKQDFPNLKVNFFITHSYEMWKAVSDAFTNIGSVLILIHQSDNIP